MSKYYADCTGAATQGRIANGQRNNNTVSEGIGYGMLMAVGNDDHSHFDKLWAYYKAHLDKNGLMNWSINACDSGDNGAYAATDADEDVAMALIQADAKWGGYKTDATGLIDNIKKFETSGTTTPTYLRPGDATNNGGKGEGTVNPSYFATGYWHVWATYMNDPFWNQLATDAYAMMAKFQALSINDAANVATTGSLVPDWGMSAGTNPNNNKYWYDACRTPWRVAVDYVWFGNTESQTFLKNVCKYIDSKGFSSIISAYNNNGAGNSAFFGPFALAGMAVSQTTADSYLNSWLSAQMDDSPYFQGALRGVYLLLANQNFPKGS
jgi:endo-1,4-beta-D-glucanase Y